MIKAVLWDFGGVITKSPFEAFNRFEKTEDLPQDFIRTVNATNPDSNAWARFERSEISPDAFNTQFRTESATLAQKIGGRAIDGQDVLRLLAGQIRPRMVDILIQLHKRGFKQGCITNNVKTGAGAGMARSDAQAQNVAQIMDIFDHVFESALIGIRKPDPRIYALACETLAIAPHEAVFLDDLGINLKPARAMGMQTIKVVSEAQAIAELEQTLETQF